MPIFQVQFASPGKFPNHNGNESDDLGKLFTLH